LGRLGYAFAAVAVMCVQGAAPSARAAPRAVVDGELPTDLRAAIEQAVGDTDRPIENRFEARRRARAAAEDAIAVLRSEGYYAYAVEAEVGEGDAPAARVKVETGPRFRLAAPAIEWAGEPPVPETQTAATLALGLAPGEPARAVDVVGAEGRAVLAIQQLGYADAGANPRDVLVDHADATVKPTYRIAAGGIVRLDSPSVFNPGRTDTDWLAGLAPWRPGATFDPGHLSELELRLLDTGVFDSVSVVLAPAPERPAGELRPVIVNLVERKPRTLELGASYATAEGLGLDARWTRYGLLGRADTLTFAARASDVDSRLGVELSLPHWRRPRQTLKAGAALYRLRTDAFDETGLGVRADANRQYGYRRTSYVTVGVSADLSRTEELRPDTLAPLGLELVTLAALGDAVLDRSDDPLDPHRGWRIGARLEPTMILGERNFPYLKIQTQGSIYLPLGADARTVVAGRLRLGSIINGDIPKTPASRRFFAGGGGSVRGFAYQSVGPRLLDNTPQGGLSLLEASAEARYDLTNRWGVVAFVDAGAVGTDKFPGPGDLSVGAGFGVRYDLGFGPIRFDIAAPLTKRRGEAAFQLYVSIGQAF
jgi:translocation and assembly module TamA